MREQFLLRPAPRRNMSIAPALILWSGFHLSKTGENELRAGLLSVRRGYVAVNRKNVGEETFLTKLFSCSSPIKRG